MPDADHTPSTDAVDAPAAPAAPSFLRWLLELLGLVAVAGLISWILLTYVVQQYEIPSASMEDTLQIGDRVAVNKLAYRLGEPQPGDIVVFASPELGTDVIKRVVAVGGQTVEVRDGVLYIDRRPRPEPYLQTSYVGDYDTDGVTEVPQRSVFVLGDNRAYSQDSRILGPQPLSRIIGRAEAIVWPPARIGALRAD